MIKILFRWLIAIAPKGLSQADDTHRMITLSVITLSWLNSKPFQNMSSVIPIVQTSDRPKPEFKPKPKISDH